MAKPEFLQLSHTFDPNKHSVSGWYYSVKLDGERAIWDGGVSRGLPASEVPYANCVKDSRLKEPPIATGLWSRTGKVIYAPDWWLDAMPYYPLDGELYNGRGGFQELRTIVGRRDADERWHLISYCVFDSPCWDRLLAPRTVKVRNEYEYEITADALDWALKRAKALGVKENWNFEFVLKFLTRAGRFKAGITVVPQQRLPVQHSKALEVADKLAREEVDAGGEGIMLRNPVAFWKPERSWDLLKHKPWHDAEARIIGYYAGKVGKHGTLQGKIGALLVDWQGTRFKIGSGMEHHLRGFNERYMTLWAQQNPGKLCPPDFEGGTLRKGDEITFKFRECSDDGVPKEARFYRVRNEY